MSLTQLIQDAATMQEAFALLKNRIVEIHVFANTDRMKVIDPNDDYAVVMITRGTGPLNTEALHPYGSSVCYYLSGRR